MIVDIRGKDDGVWQIELLESEKGPFIQDVQSDQPFIGITQRFALGDVLINKNHIVAINFT